MESETIHYKGYTVTYEYLNKITYEQFLEKCLNDYIYKEIADEIEAELEKLKTRNQTTLNDKR